jgi:hypothetical protein
MAKLPNADQAIVPDAKITDDLLFQTHRVGGPKCMFFMSFGFSSSRPAALIDALLEHARTYAATALPATKFGIKYEIIGPLRVPDARLPRVKSVWIIEPGATIPRLVTALPA